MGFAPKQMFIMRPRAAFMLVPVVLLGVLALGCLSSAVIGFLQCTSQLRAEQADARLFLTRFCDDANHLQLYPRLATQLCDQQRRVLATPVMLACMADAATGMGLFVAAWTWNVLGALALVLAAALALITLQRRYSSSPHTRAHAQREE